MALLSTAVAAFDCHHGTCKRSHTCNPFGVYCTCESTFEQGCQAPYPSYKEIHVQ